MTTARPLRADAQRNRDLVLVAAARAFGRDGSEVTPPRSRRTRATAPASPPTPLDPAKAERRCDVFQRLSR